MIHSASRTAFNLFALAVLQALVSPHDAAGQLHGTIEFPNSGAAEAQADFVEGVLYLHNFEYEEANEAFRRAQEVDPDFAMAYWGAAMTFHQSLWQKQSRTSAEDVLRRLGRTSEDRSAKAPTQREKDYIHAAETLFGMTEESKELVKFEREVRYRDAMRHIHETYPEDLEATAFYGLSILGVGSANREYATYMRAAAVLTEVWDRNRYHPGAAHYLIHSYDDPVHAVLGLPMARAYSKIAPAAAHAQHMTSHIFVPLGMWDDLVSANEAATRLETDSLTGQGERSREASHYVYWLMYGYLQQGRFSNAQELMSAARERLENHPMARERAFYGAMYGRYLFDTEKWDEAETWAAPEGVEIPTPHYHFARAHAAIQRGDLDAARDHQQYLRSATEGNPEVALREGAVNVLYKQLEALSSQIAGQVENAVALAREAVELEAGIPFRYGPPQIVKPTSEFLGDMLLSLGRSKEAATAYQHQLELTPRRTLSLLGLARAARASGDFAASADSYKQLSTIWHSAQETVPGYIEAFEVSMP